MNTALKRILVVGGNGFIGSAVCKAAVARGIQVTSVSSSGKPYRTAKGHTPAWANKVHWQQGDALHPESFSHLFPEVCGVVHTLGTLFEDADGAYKRAIRSGDVPGLFGSFIKNVIASNGNPLGKTRHEHEHGVERGRNTYEVMNRDSALRVCEAFISSIPVEHAAASVPRPFVYISAEDIFRPVIPARYIETKWEAEKGIEELVANNPDYRGVYIRPSLVYHAHQRPLTTPAAVLFDLAATLEAKVPRTLPTPSRVLRSLGSLFPHEATTGYAQTTLTGTKGTAASTASPVEGSAPAPEAPQTSSSPLSQPQSRYGSGTTKTPGALESVANALEIPPIHVDHVADAVMAALEPASGVRGVVGVRRMRELIGWSESGGNSGTTESTNRSRI